MTETGLLDDADALVFEDVEGTLTRLGEARDKISERLGAVQIEAARKIVTARKISEPLREGIEQLTGKLTGLRNELGVTKGRMSVTSELLAEAKTQSNLGYVETYRTELFEHQMQAATLMMSIEEQEDHLRNVQKRLGEEPTVLELDRAIASVEMHDKLREQLLDVTRLQNWFGRQEKADAAT